MDFSKEELDKIKKDKIFKGFFVLEFLIGIFKRIIIN